MRLIKIIGERGEEGEWEILTTPANITSPPPIVTLAPEKKVDSVAFMLFRMTLSACRLDEPNKFTNASNAIKFVAT